MGKPGEKPLPLPFQGVLYVSFPFLQFSISLNRQANRKNLQDQQPVPAVDDGTAARASRMTTAPTAIERRLAFSRYILVHIAFRNIISKKTPFFSIKLRNCRLLPPPSRRTRSVSAACYTVCSALSLLCALQLIIYFQVLECIFPFHFY